MAETDEDSSETRVEEYERLLAEARAERAKLVEMRRQAREAK